MSLIKQWKDGISFEEKTIIILFNGTRSTSSESYQDKVSELYTKYKHFFPGELISRRTEIYLCHAWLSRLQNKVLFLVNQGSFFFFFSLSVKDSSFMWAAQSDRLIQKVANDCFLNSRPFQLLFFPNFFPSFFWGNQINIWTQLTNLQIHAQTRHHNCAFGSATEGGLKYWQPWIMMQ